MGKPALKGASRHPLRAYMDEESQEPGRTKRTAVRLALSAAIRDGNLQPGDRLPPEIELTGIFAVSLGTVQAALRQLQEVGIIVRRRGDGSRVASSEPLHNSIWHFRFISLRDGRPLHPVADKITIARHSAQGIWSTFLGGQPSFIRIFRRYRAQGCAPFAAEMFLDPALFPKLAETDPQELRMVNIRTELEARYGTIVRGATQTVKQTLLDGPMAERFGLDEHLQVFEIHAEAFGPAQAPVYFQRLVVPTADYALSFSTLSKA